MKTIQKITKVLMKVLEIIHWVGAALMIGAAVSALAAPQWLGMFIGMDAAGNRTELSCYGFEIMAEVSGGKVDTKSLVLFTVCSVLLLGLMAMVFRNLYLLFKQSEGATPFQKENVRLLKEIGIFSISIPVIGLIMSGIARLVLGFDAEISVEVDGFIMGLVVLCLTQFFAHGVELEQDVDGLL